MTTAKRLEALPDVPTVAESVPGYEAIGWYGFGMPKATPSEIVDQLNEAINKALADPKLQERLATLGVEPMPMTPARVRKIRRQRSRQVDQGDPDGRRDAGVSFAAAGCGASCYALSP